MTSYLVEFLTNDNVIVPIEFNYKDLQYFVRANLATNPAPFKVDLRRINDLFKYYGYRTGLKYPNIWRVVKWYNGFIFY